MTIFLDLDETLIHSIPGRPGMGMGRRASVAVGFKDNGKPDTYHTELRNCAHTLLLRCRAAGPTRMLTTATREYALAMNSTFSLGFAPEEIIAREDYLEEIPAPYGGYDTLVKSLKFCPDSILIDNLAPTEAHAKRKMLFLGIGEDKYIQIREYIGGRDADKFQGELTAIFRRLASQNESVPGLAAVEGSRDSGRLSSAKKATTPPAALALFAHERDWHVRCAVAGNPNTPPDTLAWLSNDTHVSVRYQVAWNASTPPEAVERLREDADAHVRNAAKEALTGSGSGS